jgi:hypothetical protein
MKDEQASSYNAKKDPANKSAACTDCGKMVEASGDNCTGFGLYVCPDCWPRLDKAIDDILRKHHIKKEYFPLRKR